MSDKKSFFLETMNNIWKKSYKAFSKHFIKEIVITQK